MHKEIELLLFSCNNDMLSSVKCYTKHFPSICHCYQKILKIFWGLFYLEHLFQLLISTVFEYNQEVFLVLK